MLENYRVQVFRAVAEQASFRRAAEQLHISQPSVSQHIQLLEEELGTRLLDRTSTGVRITPAGEQLLSYARRAARMSQQLLAGLAGQEGQPGGTLRLAASTTVAQYLLPRMLAGFRKENPRIQLSARSGNTQQVTGWVLAPEVDLGLIEGPPASKEVKVEPFLDDRLTLIVPRKHPWASPRISGAITLEQLKEASFLLREPGSGTRRVMEQALRRAGLRINQLSIAMELDSTGAIVAAVEAGLGVGIVSELAIQKELRLGTVAAVSVTGLGMTRAFSLIRRRGPVEAGPVTAFREFALHHAANSAKESSAQRKQ
jgi:DNA-binding transcriptional LysR family regulator